MTGGGDATGAARSPAAPTVVADPAWLGAAAWLLLPALGGLLGWLLLPAADWLDELRWKPVRGPLKLISELPYGWALAVAVTLGVAGGATLAYRVGRDTLRVTVGADEATAARDGRSTVLVRGGTAAVFVDDGRLVALDGAGRELVRERSDQGAGRLAAAFAGHGWPWYDGDPHAEAYRPWVPGSPGLPPGAEPLFAARQRAVDRGDREEATQLRGELARLGLVVRDDRKLQHWRPHTPPTP